MIMTAAQLIAKAKEVQKSNTVYMWGTYGQKLTTSLIDAKARQYPSRNTPTRVARHKKLVGKGYCAWDCVGLIKGILWGWDKDKGVAYHGNKQVPDTGSDGMYKSYTTNQSTDFSKIVPGCAVWIPGHIGIYIGGGLVIEATSKWNDNVMTTALGNIGTVPGYYTRSWTHHGRLKWVDYGQQVEPEPEPEPTGDIMHTVAKGDTPWSLAVRYLSSGLRYKEIMAWNGLADNASIYVGQQLKIYTYGKPEYTPPVAEPEYVTHTVKKGDTPWDLAVKYLGSGAKYTEIMALNSLAKTSAIYVGQVLKIPSGEVVAEPETFKPYRATINTPNGLNVRSEPSTSGKVLRTLANKTVVTIDKEQGGWGYVSAYKGWVSLAYVVK